MGSQDDTVELLVTFTHIRRMGSGDLTAEIPVDRLFAVPGFPDPFPYKTIRLCEIECVGSVRDKDEDREIGSVIKFARRGAGHPDELVRDLPEGVLMKTPYTRLIQWMEEHNTAWLASRELETDDG